MTKMLYFSLSVLVAGAFSLAVPGAAPTAAAACQKTTKTGPLTICLPNTEPPGQAHDSEQTPPPILCWRGVNCAAVGRGQPIITAFSASPNPVAYNTQSTLSWTTSFTGSCSLTGSYTAPLNGSRLTWPLTSAQQYTLMCTGLGPYSNSTVSQSVTVQVGGASKPVVTLSLQYKTFVVNKICTSAFNRPVCKLTKETPAGNLNVTWTSTGANSCTLAKNGATIATGANGVKQTWAPWPSSFTRYPGTVTRDNFTLTCTGPGGSSAVAASDRVNGILTN